MPSSLQHDADHTLERSDPQPERAFLNEGELARVEQEEEQEIARTRRSTWVSGLLGVGMGLVLIIWAVLGPHLGDRVQLIIGLMVALEATAMGFALAIYTRHRHVGAVEHYLARLRELALRLQESSVRDSLTGLYNHGYLLSRLQDEISLAQRYDRPLSVVILDLNKFKEINDRHGHLLGDEVLQIVAATIRSDVRQHDVVARYGGDEFCLVLAETERADAIRVAEKLQGQVAALSKRLERWAGSEISFGFGVASYPEDGATVRALIAAADAELYRDKHARQGAGAHGPRTKAA